MVDLTEAVERVAVFDQFPLEDDQPNIEAPSLSVLFDGYTDYNFGDRNAFETRWTEETQYIAQLRETLTQGDMYINMIYTYRSCSKALPQVKTSDQENRNEIYEGTYEVLEPEIKKLKNFMYFQRDTVKLFCEHVKRIASNISDKKKKDELFPSESYVFCIIQLLDRFALLDALKNMKACLNNDFSFYKRAFGFLRRNMSGNDDQTQENHTLYLFLAHQNSITTNLKTEVQQIPGFDDVLTIVVNQCADYLETEKYLLPSEKHCLLRVMPYVLFLMDGEQNSQNNIFKSKKLKLPRFAALFKKYPVVPLYGDMQITLESMIKRSPHFDEKVWGAGTEQKLSIEYEIIHHLESTKAQYNEYLARFSNLINEIKALLKEKDKGVGLVLAKEVTTTVLQGLKYLADWSSKVLQQSAWKYAKPNNDPSINSSVDYERVVRHNFTSDEKFALVEFISMIKGLAGVMSKEDGVLSPIINLCIHDEIQEFIQIGLRDLIRHVTKKKKKEARNELMQMRYAGADWFTGMDPGDPGESSSKKSSSKDSEKIQIPSRAVGPSPTQLELVRNTVYGLLSKKKDYSSSHVKLLEEFYERSFFYRYLLNYTGTILSATDLGDLWYKEFYLELSKRLQFPIDMSLPWILADHILESKEPHMMEYVFYPLDLYNDAAHRALVSLNQQFLYDEIEAEVNLCFDQLVYKLSEQIYAYFKSQASSILMDKPYKAQLEALFGAHRLHVPKSRYDVLLKQRHVQLLGRSIDLNHLIAQRMNTYLRQNIDFAINRFEASDLTGIIELESIINNVRLTYALLSKYFDLDPWESIFNEVNESTSLVSFHGRIVLHVIFELVYDFAPNWNHNGVTNRFVRTPLAFSDEVPRDAMPKSNPNFLYGSKALNLAYANSMELFKKFIGKPHIDAILRLVGKSNIPLVVSECLQNMDLKIRNVLAPYVRELMGGMPASSKLPIHDYGTEGGFGYFQLKLKDIITYPDLRPEVLQNFKEMGNLILFLKLSDTSLSQQECLNFSTYAPFLGVTTEKPTATEQQITASAPLYVTVSSLAAYLESAASIAKAPSILREQVNNAWKADKYYRAPTVNHSLFKAVLQRISSMLDSVRPEWGAVQAENGVMQVDSTSEFYRLWSGLQFVCCLPTGENELSNHELFGDGLFWAGCTIIHFLQQQHRFEVFDFSYHILNVEESASVPCTNPQIHQFFKKVANIRDINQSVFNALKAYQEQQPQSSLVLHPPEDDHSEQFLSASQTGATLRGTRPLSTAIPNSNHGAPPPPPRD